MDTPSILCPACLEPVVASDEACPSCGTTLASKTRRILNRAARRHGGGGGGGGERSVIGSRQDWMAVKDAIETIRKGLLYIVFSILLLIVPLIGLLGLVGIIVGAIMIVVGMIGCLRTPSESGLKGLISFSVTLFLLGIIGSIAVAVMQVSSMRSGFGGGGGLAAGMSNQPLLEKVVNSLSLISNVLFLLFIRGVGNYFGNYQLSGQAVGLLAVNLVLAAVQIGLGAALEAGAIRDTTTLLYIMIGLGVTGLVVLVWNIGVLGQAVSTISNAMTKARRFARAVNANMPEGAPA